MGVVGAESVAVPDVTVAAEEGTSLVPLGTGLVRRSAPSSVDTGRTFAPLRRGSLPVLRALLGVGGSCRGVALAPAPASLSLQGDALRAAGAPCDECFRWCFTGFFAPAASLTLMLISEDAAGVLAAGVAIGHLVAAMSSVGEKHAQVAEIQS